MTRHVVVYTQNNAFASTIVGPLEVFAYTGGMWNFLMNSPLELQFRVTVASLDGNPVVTRTGLVIQVDQCIFDVGQADFVLITSCGEDIETSLKLSAPVIPWLRQQHAQGVLLGSVCSGLALLAATGLLDGKRATTHWGLLDRMRKKFPALQLQSDQLYVEEPGIVTAGGGYAGTDLALHMVEKWCGATMARQCANAMLLDVNRESQAVFAGIQHHRMHQDERVQQIQNWLDAHFHEEINLDSLAAGYNMSPRNFKRRFKQASGDTPLRYLQKLRIEAAKRILETSDTQVERVAELVGYKDDNYFRQLFNRYTSFTPMAYRNRYGMSKQIQSNQSVKSL